MSRLARSCISALRDLSVSSPSATSSSAQSQSQFHQVTRSLRVLAFGHGVSGALGLGDLLDSHEPALVENLPDDVTSISCGHFHSVAVTSSGEVWTWGRNQENQLGHCKDTFRPSDFNPLVSDTPQRVEAEALRGVDVRQTCASGVATFAVGSDGVAYSWGSSKRGQLGLGLGVTESALPRAISCEFPLKEIQCGWGHAVGIANTEGGELMSWGYPVDGRLGYGYSSSELQQQQHQGTVMDGSAEEEEAVAACVWQPKQVSRLSGVKIVGASCGADHTVVVTEWGAAFSFGDDSMNQLGTGRDSLHSSGLSGPMGLYSAENSNSQMVHLSEEYAGGGIGFQRVDSLGSNATDVIHSVLFPNPVKVEKLVSGYAHTLALVQQCRSANPNWNNPNSKGEEAKGGDMVMFDEVNCVYSWGWDSADQLGHGGFEGVGLPAYVQGFQGDYFSPRGEGEGGDGQSEDATTTTAPIMNLMDPVMIGAGRVHSVVLTRDNSLYTWGSSSNGRLGQYLFQKDGMQQMQQATTAMPQKVHIPEELNVSEIVDIKCGFDHTLLLVK